MKIFEIGQNHLLEKKLISIIKWGIYISLLAPLIVLSGFYLPFIVPKTIFFRIIIEVVFSAYLILILFSPKYRPKMNFLSGGILIYILIYIFSSLFGMDLSRSFWGTYQRMTGLFTLAHLYMFFLVLSNVFQKEKDWNKLFLFFIAVSLISALTFSIYGYYGEQGAGIGNSSFWASYLLFGIFLSLYLFLKDKEISFTKFFSFATFLIMAATLLLSTANMARYAFLIGFGLIILSFLAFSKNIKNTIGLIFLIIVLALVSIFYYSFIKEFVIGLLQTGTMRERYYIWEIAWKGFLEKPFLGWGPENFNILYAKFFEVRPQLSSWRNYSIWFDRPHNMFLNTLIESGLIGLTSYLSLFFISVFYLFKKTKKYYPIIILLFVYFVQNITVFDTISSYLSFFLILAFVNFLIKKEVQKEERVELVNNNLLRKIYAGFIILVTILTIYIGNIQPALSARKVFNIQNIEDINQKFKNYKESLKTLRYPNEINREAIDSLVNENLSKIEDQELLRSFLELIEKEIKKEVQEQPFNLRAKIDLFKTYSALYEVTQNSKYLNLGGEILNEAIKLTPKKEDVYSNLISYYIEKKAYQEVVNVAQKMKEQGLEWNIYSDYFEDILFAYEMLEKNQEVIPLYQELLKRKKRDADLWLKLSVAFFNLGQKEEAKSAAQKAVKFDPTLKNKLGDIIDVLLQSD
jgi:putative inorganic carbon (HCO3(-)) transporter